VYAGACGVLWGSLQPTMGQQAYLGSGLGLGRSFSLLQPLFFFWNKKKSIVRESQWTSSSIFL
jgi:hypothetical protein